MSVFQCRCLHNSAPLHKQALVKDPGFAAQQGGATRWILRFDLPQPVAITLDYQRYFRLTPWPVAENPLLSPDTNVIFWFHQKDETFTFYVRHNGEKSDIFTFFDREVHFGTGKQKTFVLLALSTETYVHIRV